MKKILVGLTTLLLASGISTTISAATLHETLNNADRITLKEKFFRLSTAYGIYVDNQEVGQVTGDFIHPFGDTLRITDTDGRTVYSEKQNRRLLHLSVARSGAFYDANGQLDGGLREDVWALFFHRYRLLNNDGKIVGESVRDPWHFFSTQYNVKNAAGDTVYRAVQHIDFPTSHIDIKKIQADKHVTAEKTIMVSVIEEAIAEHAAKKSR